MVDALPCCSCPFSWEPVIGRDGDAGHDGKAAAV